LKTVSVGYCAIEDEELLNETRNHVNMTHCIVLYCFMHRYA